MSGEQNKAVVRSALAAFNAGDMQALAELVVGVEPWRRGLAELRRAFPDGQATIEELIAEGDLVVERWTFRGTHQGPFMGATPSGRQLSWSGINVLRVVEGRIVERRALVDRLALMEQLGLLSVAI